MFISSILYCYVVSGRAHGSYARWVTVYMKIMYLAFLLATSLNTFLVFSVLFSSAFPSTFLLERKGIDNASGQIYKSSLKSCLYVRMHVCIRIHRCSDVSLPEVP